MADSAQCGAARDEFIILYVADRDRGRVRGEAEYVRLYPGCEDVISREWRRLQEIQAHGAATADAPSIPPPEDRPRALGRYRIESELGRGAQGTVFLAVDTHLRRRVALKVLKASWSGSEAMVRRFALEAQALARFDLPGIVAVHDAGSAHGLEYFAMRYVDGRTLAREVADRASRTTPLVADRAAALRYVTIIEKCSRALHVAHESGLIHRDFKPSNVMITAGDEPVVLDFGLARLLDAEVRGLTGTADILGTPGYMAPEQVAGDRARVDRRVDVYALGVTLRALLADLGPRPLGRSRDLDAVLDVATDPAPDRRHATAASFGDDLARVRRGLPVSVRPIGPLRRFASWVRRAPSAAALVLLPPIGLVLGLVAVSTMNDEIEAATRDLAAREIEADAAARKANDRFAAFQRLEDLRLVRQLEERERELWPLHPAAVPRMERWLADAANRLRRLPGHRDALAAVRGRGSAAARREVGLDPVIDELLHVERVVGAARAEIAAAWTPESRRSAMTVIVENAAPKLEDLEAGAASRPTWTFAEASDQWLHDNLAQLVARLEALDESSVHGCNRAAVRKRIATARSLENETVVAPATAWRDAVTAIANSDTDPAYAGLRIEPILGLVPIGRDPRSKLWEFAHVLSGTPPARDVAGNLVITEKSSIVLVLVPGMTARIGARPPFDDEQSGRDHVDPAALAKEGPPHEVLLDPFFLSKYEMTQGQWLHLTGANPAHGRPDRAWTSGFRPTLRHPVEQVSFEDCAEVLWRYGLALPTEAQWEAVARAGTTTPWWPGETIASFLTVENLADLTYVEDAQVLYSHDAERRDGWSGTAPIGIYPANAFGFHDVIGNVIEWCADRMHFYKTPGLPGDGLRADGLLDAHAVRGGAFNTTARSARSSFRYGVPASSRSGWIGVRPGRPLSPP